MASNAEHLRRWLFGCGAIDATKRFGVDYLGDVPTEYALITAPSVLKWRENVLGEWKLLPEQEQEFSFEARSHYGTDAAQNLDNLAFCQAVADWIIAQSAAGSFPEWEGGTVTGVAPALTGAPVEFGAGDALYRIRIKVNYRIN